MYAAGLATDNNVHFIVDVCKEMKILEELWICGTGEDQTYIEQVAKSYSKIKYFGRLDNSKVVELENNAKLLVNLRSPVEVLTD